VKTVRLAEPSGPWAPAPDSELEPGQAEVWLFRPSEATARGVEGVLTEDELERAQRFRRPAPRARYVSVRGTLRTILSSYLDLPPRDITIVYGAQGKPRLSPRVGSPLGFNVSHSGDLAAVAVTPAGEIGVDVEARIPRERMPGIAARMLAPAELAWFEALPAGDRTAAFFDLWSAKEACSKLIGRGLTMPFAAIALTSPDAAFSRVEVHHPSAPERPCMVRRLPVERGYSGALALV
jgi:4'-phosphopantetheinyl transferase